MQKDKVAMDINKIKPKTKKIGQNIYYIKECTSTNTLAKNNSHLPDCTIFICNKQTSGRGRHGKSWVSDCDGSIAMSILIKPDLLPEKAQILTLIAGLSVKNALCELFGADIYIKWPNDLVLNKKKICGILCEISAQVNLLNYCICGIGINLNNASFPDEIKSIATSLFSETGKKLLKETVISKIPEEFERLYTEFLKNGLKNLISDYKKSLITLNKEVKIISPDDSYTAICEDIGENGELIIRTKDGIKTISSGEVSVRGILGYI